MTIFSRPFNRALQLIASSIEEISIAILMQHPGRSSLLGTPFELNEDVHAIIYLGWSPISRLLLLPLATFPILLVIVLMMVAVSCWMIRSCWIHHVTTPCNHHRPPVTLLWFQDHDSRCSGAGGVRRRVMRGAVIVADRESWEMMVNTGYDCDMYIFIMGNDGQCQQLTTYECMW